MNSGIEGFVSQFPYAPLPATPRVWHPESRVLTRATFAQRLLLVPGLVVVVFRLTPEEVVP